MSLYFYDATNIQWLHNSLSFIAIGTGVINMVIYLRIIFAFP